MGIVGGFSSSFLITASGLRDANLRMSVTAGNIANLNTDNFVPSRVSSQSVQGGGVRSVIEPGTPPPELVATGEDFASQTDLTNELVNMLIAQRAFEANAVALKTESETSKTLIDAFA